MILLCHGPGDPMKTAEWSAVCGPQDRAFQKTFVSQGKSKREVGVTGVAPNSCIYIFPRDHREVAALWGADPHPVRCRKQLCVCLQYDVFLWALLVHELASTVHGSWARVCEHLPRVLPLRACDRRGRVSLSLLLCFSEAPLHSLRTWGHL